VGGFCGRKILKRGRGNRRKKRNEKKREQGPHHPTEKLIGHFSASLTEMERLTRKQYHLASRFYCIVESFSWYRSNELVPDAKLHRVTARICIENGQSLVYSDALLIAAQIMSCVVFFFLGVAEKFCSRWGINSYR